MSAPSPSPSIERIMGLAPLQRAILFHALAAPDSLAYFEQIVCRLSGELAPDRFREALAALIARHDALRCGFVTRGQKEPRQIVFDAATVPLSVEDWRHFSLERREDERARLLDRERREGFRFNRAPLMRMVLIREEEAVWTLVWSHHHIVLDGWSVAVLLEDFFALLADPCRRLPPPARFEDYIAWVGRQDPGPSAAAWRNILHGAVMPTPLGIDSAARRGRSGQCMRALHAQLPVDAVTRAATAARVTVGTVLTGAFGLLLSRLARTDDVVLGMVLSGRQAPVEGIERMVGLLANSVPLRLVIPPDQSIIDWLADVQRRQHELHTLAHCAIADIRAWAGVPTDRPLFECLVAVDNFPVRAGLDIGDAGLSLSDAYQEEHTELPLVLTFVPTSDRIGVKLGIDEARIDPETAANLLRSLTHVLHEIAERPAAPTSDIGLRPDIASRPGRGGGTDAVSDASLGEMFLNVAARHGSRTAVTDADGSVTYASLAARARAIAGQLVQRGMEPGDRVALLLDRDATQVAAILGVLLAGGCYVPLDSTHPPDRLAHIVSDSGARHILAVSSTIVCLPEAQGAILLDEAPSESVDIGELRPVSAALPAYLVYTSGSTGAPKGVVVSHRNVRRLFDVTRSVFGFAETDVWSSTHSFAFDFSTWELWGALLHGGRVVLVPRDVARDPEALLALLAAERVTMLSQTPSSFRLLDAADASARPNLALRHVVFGGEALHGRDLVAWVARRGDAAPCLTNMYGITETTVHATVRRLRRTDLATDLSLIGAPLDDLDIRLVDRLGHDVPDGATGEILVSGAGVALGYHGRPDLTRERFRGDENARVYHSGDLAWRLSTGELVFAGRSDAQIKIRGHRIEPNEVRAALLGHPAVRDAFVMAESGVADPRLIAWFVPESDCAIEVDALRSHLGARLPAHEIPSLLVRSPPFALTANGKLDLAALPPPVRSDEPVRRPPFTQAQTMLCEIWQEVLQVEAVGITDDYFALGGDSIRSIRIAGLARERGVSIDIVDLFRLRTIEAILQAERSSDDVEPALAARKPFSMIDEAEQRLLPDGIEDAYPLARLQAGMLFHTQSEDGRRLYHDVFCFHVKAHLRLDAVTSALETLVASHPVLRTSFLIDGGERPLQLVHATAVPELQVEDLRDLDPSERDDRFTSLLDRLRDHPFDPSRPMLMRVVVQRLGDEQWQIGGAVHHAILDGWSVATWLSQLVLLSSGRAIEAPTTPYREFIRLEQAAIANPDDARFWNGVVDGAPLTAVPSWPHPAHVSGLSRVGKHERTLPGRVADGLHALARRHRLPLKSLVLAIHARVLALVCGQDEILSGLVSNGRPPAADGGEMLGLFLNTVPFRLRVGEKSWLALAADAARAEEDLLSHRRYPMAEMLRGRSGDALFETSFNFVDFHAYSVSAHQDHLTILGARSVEAFEMPCATTFSVARDGVEEGLTLGLSYDRGAFPDMQIAWLADLYERAAEDFVAVPDGTWRDDPLAQPEGLAAVRRRAGGFKRPVLSGDLLAQFKAVVARQPDRHAVRGHDGALDFMTLDVRSDRIAAGLTVRGVGPDRIVALAFEPGDTRMVVALLGVFKAGGASFLLDLSLPDARRRRMLEAAQPWVLLGTAATLAVLPNGFEDASLDELLAEARPALTALCVPDEALAYLIFTSGSTGVPKAVGIPRSALSNHMAWLRRRFPLTDTDVVLQKTPVGFDASVWEFWAPLTEGAVLSLAPARASRETDALCDAVAQSKATVLQIVPSLLDTLLDDESAVAKLGTLSRVFVGGEALRAATAQRFLRTLPARLINLYGPAETTIDATSAVIEPASAEPSLGQAVDNTFAFVLDDRLRPVAPGVSGEIWIGGAAVGRGYQDRPGETARRFRPDHLTGLPGARLYRTGDRARHLPDGRLLFIGRADNQVKLRGWRVELGEVESLLLTHPAVRRCAVIACDGRDGATRLVAFVERQRAYRGGTTDYRAFLRDMLPVSLLPGAVHEIDEWPLLANGKTDRGGFPDFGERVARLPHREPMTPAQQILAGIWRELLPGDGTIGVDDDFFELGGDSIIGLQITSRARRHGLLLSPRDVFEHPTIAALASVAGRRDVKEAPPAPAGPVPLTPAQAWFFSLEQPVPAHWNQAFLLRIPGLKADIVEAAMCQILGAHEAFRLRFEIGRSGVVQELTPTVADAERWFQSVSDGGEHDALRWIASAAQENLDLASAPLLRAVHIHGLADGSNRLLLVMHHLIVDGVSWRVLMADLVAAFGGTDIERPEIGFAGWARSIAATPPISGDEADYWRGIVPRALEAGRLRPAGSALPLYRDMRTIERSLDAFSTVALLRNGASRLRASAQEIMVAAVATAILQSTGGHSVGMTVEHHGRVGDEDAAIARSVGWFTTLYPLLITDLDVPWPVRRLRTVKKAMRTVPNVGRGFGRLAQDEGPGSPSSFLLPDISFNYLGQTEGALDAAAGVGVAPEPVGATEAGSNRRPHALEIVALVVDGRLLVRWMFDANCPGEAAVQAMADRAMAELAGLLAAEEPDDAALASDFPLVTLDDDFVAKALGGAQIADIWSPTAMQEGMLFHSRAAGRAAGLYLEQIVATIEGPCDEALLAEAWSLTYARHDALHVGFTHCETGRPVQLVHHPRPIEWTVREIPGTDGTDEALERFLDEDRARGFDLEQPPLMRLTMLRSSGTRSRLVWTHHHTLLDGWSMAIVFSEVATCYAALLRGAQPVLPPPPSFAGFMSALHRRTRPRKQSEDFWTGLLGRSHEPLDLGFDPPARSPQPRRTRRRIDPSLSGGIGVLAAREHVTVSTVIQGAYALLLSRIARTDDVAFGVTLSGRTEHVADVERMVGLMISTLPIRVDCAPHLTPGDFLRGLFAVQNAIADHTHTNLADIQAWSGASAQQPLFETVYIYENYPVDSLASTGPDGLQVTAIDMREASNYPLTLYVEPHPDGIVLTGLHDEHRFPAARAETILDALETIIAGLAGADVGAIGALALGPPDRPDAGPREADTLVAMLDRACMGDAAPKIVGPDRTSSRTDLLRQAGALAAHLRTCGAGTGTVVAVCLPRGVDLIAGLLGVMMSGAAYLPIDPTLPDERGAMMLEDAMPVAIVMPPGSAIATPPGLPRIAPTAGSDHDGGGLPRPHGEDLAYTIFTSGSTGRPKGVEVRHGALANVLADFTGRFPMTGKDVLLSVTTVSFDIAALEFFLPLVTGATLVIASSETAASGIALMEEIERHCVTVLQATPATWRLLIAAGWQPRPGFRAWCGGEMLPRDVAGGLLARGVDVVNVYGPTETTIWSAARHVGEPETCGHIGGPVRDTQLHVVDPCGHAVPPGIAGELMIGGAGLARGYLRAPGSTARSFRPDPFSAEPGARLYATGDLAIRCRNGEIRLLGRTDDQIKISGWRIELGDVEHALRHVPGVADAAVSVMRSADGQPSGLAAHLVADQAGPTPDEASVLGTLSGTLPRYMMPRRVFPIEALPRTASGKLDRRALQDRGAVPPSDVARRSTRGTVEEAVCALWSDLLGSANIHPDSDFFAHGGNSLLLTRVHARIIRIFGVEPPLGEMLTSQTPALMAALVESLGAPSGQAASKARAYLRLRGMTEAERDELRRARTERLDSSPTHEDTHAD